MFQQTNEGIVFFVKVIPKSFKNEIVGWKNGALKIRLKAIPEKGEANLALLHYLAEVLEISKSNVQLLYGEKGRLKRVMIKEISLKEIQDKLKIEFK